MERPESRKIDIEPKGEKEATAQEVVERFRAGESFYIHHNGWGKVVEMMTESEFDAGRPEEKKRSRPRKGEDVYYQLEGNDGTRWGVLSASDVIDNQEIAKKNFVPEYLIAQRKIAEKEMREIDYTDRSTEHKRQIVNERYASRITKEVIDELQPREARLEPSYQNGLHHAIQAITDWSAGIDLAEGQRIYPGWNQEDFAELLKLIIEKREQLHQTMMENFNKRESYELIVQKIEEGKKAKKRLDELTFALQVEHGAFLMVPNRH